MPFRWPRKLGLGWPCLGGVTPPGTVVVGAIGSWVPGISAVAYPEGTGSQVRAGALAVIQVHYNLAGGADPDRTRFEVSLAPAGADRAPLRGLTMRHRTLDIAPGVERAEFSATKTADEWMRSPFADGDGYIVSATAHAHLLGIEMTLLHNGEPVLHIPRWDFHWQGRYFLREPIRFENTDEFEIRCVYNNSDSYRTSQGLGPSQWVTWGEGTEDEMCLGGFQVVDELPDVLDEP